MVRRRHGGGEEGGGLFGRLLKALGLVSLLGLAAALWGFGIEPGLTMTRRLTIASDHWPADAPPLKIAFLSDLHIGALHAGPERLEDLAARVNAEQPDLILLGGDYPTHALFARPVAPNVVADGLAKFKARYGIFSVLGNHDWWEGGEQIRFELERVGIAVLENNAEAVETPQGRLWIAGLADATTRKPDIAAALSGVPDGDPLLLLSHDPATFPTHGSRPILALSGHTHGGQVALPLIGALVIPGEVPRELAYGLHEQEGRRIYVTSGIGTSIIPVRFFMPPEIVFITIKRQ